jgi:acyl-CoA dehydrogenase
MVRDEIAPLDAEYHGEVGRHPSGDRFAMTDRQVEILKSLKEKAKAKGPVELLADRQRQGLRA